MSYKFVTQYSEKSIRISVWMDDRLYFSVENPKAGEYPNSIRMLISFNTDDGKFHSGQYKHYAVRKGWATYIRKLIGYKPFVQQEIATS